MKFSHIFVVSIICFILIFDAGCGRIDKEEKVVYALISAFLCGMFFGELFINYMHKRYARELFGAASKNFTKMSDLFSRERELCELFIKNRRTDTVSIDYNISTRSVDIMVFYLDKEDWNIENGEKDLNRLWKNFNFAFIGYKSECLTLNYPANGLYVTEYFFPMKFFNIDTFYSLEFQKFESEY